MMGNSRRRALFTFNYIIYQTRYFVKDPGGFRFSIELHMGIPVIRGCPTQLAVYAVIGACLEGDQVDPQRTPQAPRRNRSVNVSVTLVIHRLNGRMR